MNADTPPAAGHSGLPRMHEQPPAELVRDGRYRFGTYDGPNRISTDGQAQLLTDLVRTGDFEAVLTWVAGTTNEVPFRVTTLRSPTRIAIDLAT